MHYAQTFLKTGQYNAIIINFIPGETLTKITIIHNICLNRLLGTYIKKTISLYKSLKEVYKYMLFISS